jgi:hypothetical protein
MHKSKSSLLFIILTLTVIFSCSKNTNNSDNAQPIITADSSEFNGRLKAEIRGLNNNYENNAIVYLYATYPDFLNGLPLNYVFSNTLGIADFGYVLQGNYYLFARSSGNSLLTDTVAVQVLSKRETIRTMRVSN